MDLHVVREVCGVEDRALVTFAARPCTYTGIGRITGKAKAIWPIGNLRVSRRGPGHGRVSVAVQIDIPITKGVPSVTSSSKLCVLDQSDGWF